MHARAGAPVHARTHDVHTRPRERTEKTRRTRHTTHRPPAQCRSASRSRRGCSRPDRGLAAERSRASVRRCGGGGGGEPTPPPACGVVRTATRCDLRCPQPRGPGCPGLLAFRARPGQTTAPARPTPRPSWPYLEVRTLRLQPGRGRSGGGGRRCWPSPGLPRVPLLIQTNKPRKQLEGNLSLFLSHPSPLTGSSLHLSLIFCVCFQLEKGRRWGGKRGPRAGAG